MGSCTPALGCAEVLDRHLHRRKRRSPAGKPISVDCDPKLCTGLPESLLLPFKMCAFLETENCCLALPALDPVTDLKAIIKPLFPFSPFIQKTSIY